MLHDQDSLAPSRLELCESSQKNLAWRPRETLDLIVKSKDLQLNAWKKILTAPQGWTNLECLADCSWGHLSSAIVQHNRTCTWVTTQCPILRTVASPRRPEGYNRDMYKFSARGYAPDRSDTKLRHLGLWLARYGFDMCPLFSLGCRRFQERSSDRRWWIWKRGSAC